MVGYESLYLVSSCGDIYSLKTASIRKNTMYSGGYYKIDLAKAKTVPIHRIVAMTYIPNPHNLPYVNHIDGDKTNNCVDNLEWCSAQQNAQHAIDTGLNKVCRKLTDEDVKFIRDNYIKGDKIWGLNPLSRKYGVSRATIRSVLLRLTHKNI